jgi:hypothetical protein
MVNGGAKIFSYAFCAKGKATLPRSADSTLTVENAGLALGFGLVDGSHLFAESFALGNAALGRFDALDATPTLATLGVNLAHFLARMVGSAVVAVNKVSHGNRTSD